MIHRVGKSIVGMLTMALMGFRVLGIGGLGLDDNSREIKSYNIFIVI
jgi:hypothetical protein